MLGRIQGRFDNPTLGSTFKIMRDKPEVSLVDDLRGACTSAERYKKESKLLLHCKVQRLRYLTYLCLRKRSNGLDR